MNIKVVVLVRGDRAKYSGGVYNEPILVVVICIVVYCLINGLETGCEDGSGSVSRVLGSISRLLAPLSAAAPAIGCNVTLLAAFVAFDTGLNVLCALSSSLFLPLCIRLGRSVRVSR